MGGVMRQIRLAGMVVTLGLVFWACGSSARATLPPATTSQPTSPSAQPSPAPAASPADAAQTVIDAALATLAEGTLRYDVEVRSANLVDTTAPVTGRGQVSFGEPVQFRFASAGVAGRTPPSEVIFDGERGFVRGRDLESLPPDTWLVFDLGPDVAAQVRDVFIRQYGSAALVLVLPLGATGAREAGEETIRGVTTRRFVTDVDVAAARRHVPDDVLPAYDSRLSAFEARGTALTHEVEVWIDPEGRVVRTRYVQDASSTITPIRVTYDLGDFGAPMDAAPPDGAVVLKLDEARERYRKTQETPPPASP